VHLNGPLLLAPMTQETYQGTEGQVLCRPSSSLS
jgi:hypothetical protein